MTYKVLTYKVDMTIKVRVHEVVSLMKTDSKYKKFKQTFTEHEDFRMPVQQLLAELKSSHRDRKVRKLNPTDPKFVDKIIAANLDDVARRSRITEILIRCVRTQSLMQDAMDSLRYHLLSTYAIDLKAFSTKDERLQIVNMALRRFMTYYSELSVLKESANLVISDIDKSSWALKLTVEAVRLTTTPERTSL